MGDDNNKEAPARHVEFLRAVRKKYRLDAKQWEEVGDLISGRSGYERDVVIVAATALEWKSGCSQIEWTKFEGGLDVLSSEESASDGSENLADPDRQESRRKQVSPTPADPDPPPLLSLPAKPTFSPREEEPSDADDLPPVARTWERASRDPIEPEDVREPRPKRVEIAVDPDLFAAVEPRRVVPIGSRARAVDSPRHPVADDERARLLQILHLEGGRPIWHVGPRALKAWDGRDAVIRAVSLIVLSWEVFRELFAVPSDIINDSLSTVLVWRDANGNKRSLYTAANRAWLKERRFHGGTRDRFYRFPSEAARRDAWDFVSQILSDAIEARWPVESLDEAAKVVKRDHPPKKPRKP